MAELSIGLQLTRQIAAGEAAEARYEFIEPEHLFIGLFSLGKILQAVELGQLIAPKEVIMALRPEWKVLVELLAKFHLTRLPQLGADFHKNSTCCVSNRLIFYA